MTIEQKKLSEFVYDFRKRNDLTITKLSELSGVPLSSIVKIEEGVSAPEVTRNLSKLIKFIAPNERIVEVFSDGEIFIETEINPEDFFMALPVLEGLLHYHERLMINSRIDGNCTTDMYAKALRTAISCVEIVIRQIDKKGDE